MSPSLDHAITAIQSGDVATAQAQLMQLLRQDVRNEGAWLLLAQCVIDEAQRRTCLQRVIALNPANELAQRLLAVLDDLPTPSALEPEGFQPRPFNDETQTSSPVSGKAATQPAVTLPHNDVPAFHPQPFAFHEAEAEAASGQAAAMAQSEALPPWVRSPR